jgi:hypothetical protein
MGERLEREEQMKDLIDNLNLWAESYKGKPISLSLFRAATILRVLEEERDDTRELLRQTQELCHEYLDAKIKAERELAKAKEELTMLEE